MANIYRFGGNEDLIGYKYKNSGISGEFPVYAEGIAWDIETTTNNETYSLSYQGTGYLNWGDNITVELNNAGTFGAISHTFAIPGIYTIMFIGSITRVQAGTDDTQRAKVKTIHVLNTSTYTGAGKTSNNNGEFFNCINAILNPNFTLGNNITNLIGTFYNCSSITELPLIPSGFSGSMSNTFNGCSLATLPSGFTIPAGVTSLTGTFNGCSSITELPLIPSGFSGSMSNTFYGCSLATLPSGFTIPAGVTALSSTFYNCSNIGDISSIWPAAFTKTNIDVSYMFYRPTVVANKPYGTLPAALLWGDTSGTWGNAINAFTNCTSLTNYSSIPSTWK